MRLRCLKHFFWLTLCVSTTFTARATAAYDNVAIETSSTSIYIGKVTLTVVPLTRQNGVFSSDYKAKVFPYFFMSEHGTFRMNVSDEDLARIAKGETMDFTGEAENSDHEARKIDLRATPSDAMHGKIKIRIFVTKKIQLIFNTTYRFGG